MNFNIQSRKPEVQYTRQSMNSKQTAHSALSNFHQQQPPMFLGQNHPTRAHQPTLLSRLYTGIKDFCFNILYLPLQQLFFSPIANPASSARIQIKKVSAAQAVSSSHSTPALQDRYIGTLLGLAVGDALGCDIEGKSAQEILSKNSGRKKTEITGGKNGPPQAKYRNQPYCYRKGEMTDDTAMPLIMGKQLIQSLFQNKDLSKRRHLNEFLWNTLQGLNQWIQDGAQGTGGTTRSAARSAAAIMSAPGKDYLSQDPKQVGISYANGNAPLTRGIPLALVFAQDKPQLEFLTKEACQISHQAPEAVASAVAYNFILADALTGKIKDRASLEQSYEQAANRVKDICSTTANDIRLALQLKDYGTNKQYTDRRIQNTLRISLWAFAKAFPKTGQAKWNLEKAVIEVANKGGDADSNAAVAGALYGALQGKWAVPGRWHSALLTRDQQDPKKPYLYYREDVEKMGKDLYRYRFTSNTNFKKREGQTIME